MSVNKVNSDGTVKRIAGGTLYADAPLGTILAYGGATAPAGWMLCQGQALSRTTYAKLFEIIGTAFGSGDGSTTFNLPDLREATTKGIGENPNGAVHVKSGGLALGEFLDDRVQDHKHDFTRELIANTGGTALLTQSGNHENGRDSKTSNVSSDYRSGATTEVKAIGVNYIIKVMMVSLPADLEAQVEKAVAAKLTNKWTTYDTIQNSTTSSEVSGTVSKDGMLNISIATGNSHSDGRVLCYINDIEVFNINNITGTTISIGARQTFRVNKGDTYKFTPQNGGIIYQVLLYHN